MAAERGSASSDFAAGHEGATMDQRMTNVENGCVEFQVRIDRVSATLVELGDLNAQTATELNILRRDVGGATTAALETVNAKFDEQQAAIMAVINGARAEFDLLKNSMQNLYGGTSVSFQEVQSKVLQLEQEVANLRNQPPQSSATATSNNLKTRGFLPLKEQIPKAFGKKEADWRAWQEDATTYLDAVEPGIAVVLKDAEACQAEIDTAWILNKSALIPNIATKSQDLHRCLKALTEDEARMVVQGVRFENGFEAWRLLSMRYGLATAARQGQAMADVISVTQRPCRTPADTRARVIELEGRVRVAEEITGQRLDDNHVKSILAACLDPLTRAHTTHLVGANTSYQDLKRGVLEFAANNVSISTIKTGSAASPMDIGAFVSSGEEESENPTEWDPSIADPLAAVTPSTQCYKCGGYGHISAQCPSQTSKGKGKGGTTNKGKGKGSQNPGQQSKGSGKGAGKTKGPLKGSCWICQGPHYQDQCPYNKGKGQAKGYTKGTYSFEEWPQPAEVRSLCRITTANRFAALAEPDQPKPAAPASPRVCAECMGCSSGSANKDSNCNQGRQVTSSLINAGVGGNPSGTPNVSSYKAAILEPRWSARKGTPARGMEKGSIGQVSALGGLMPLMTIEPGDAPKENTVGGWERVNFAIDSGASETVVPPSLLKDIVTTEGEASRRGILYEVANGERIPNLGEKTFQGETHHEGIVRQVRAQVCDVSKPLMSVAKLVKAGNTVVFSPQGSWIYDQSADEYMTLEEEAGMYTLGLWTRSASTSSPGF